MPLPFFNAYAVQRPRIDAAEALEQVTRGAFAAATLTTTARREALRIWTTALGREQRAVRPSGLPGLRHLARTSGIGVRVVKKARPQ
jgi:hypothetical protein